MPENSVQAGDAQLWEDLDKVLKTQKNAEQKVAFYTTIMAGCAMFSAIFLLLRGLLKVGEESQASSAPTSMPSFYPTSLNISYQNSTLSDNDHVTQVDHMVVLRMLGFFVSVVLKSLVDNLLAIQGLKTLLSDYQKAHQEGYERTWVTKQSTALTSAINREFSGSSPRFSADWRKTQSKWLVNALQQHHELDISMDDVLSILDRKMPWYGEAACVGGLVCFGSLGTVALNVSWWKGKDDGLALASLFIASAMLFALRYNHPQQFPCANSLREALSSALETVVAQEKKAQKAHHDFLLSPSAFYQAGIDLKISSVKSERWDRYNSARVCFDQLIGLVDSSMNQEKNEFDSVRQLFTSSCKKVEGAIDSEVKGQQRKKLSKGKRAWIAELRGVKRDIDIENVGSPSVDMIVALKDKLSNMVVNARASKEFSDCLSELSTVCEKLRLRLSIQEGLSLINVTLSRHGPSERPLANSRSSLDQLIESRNENVAEAIKMFEKVLPLLEKYRALLFIDQVDLRKLVDTSNKEIEFYNEKLGCSRDALTFQRQ